MSVHSHNARSGQLIRQALADGFQTFRVSWAPAADILQWFKIAALIALVMLFGVAGVAYLLPGDATAVIHSTLLDDTPEWENVRQVFARNILVLAIHLAACYVGAIIGREHKPLTGRWSKLGFLHREVSPAMARFALLYALMATLASIALQTTGLGFAMADISDNVGVTPAALTLLVTPHAVLELTAVFLPLALFLVQARRSNLKPLSAYSRQSAYLAVPLIVVAATVEVYVSPHIIAAFV